MKFDTRIVKQSRVRWNKRQGQSQWRPAKYAQEHSLPPYSHNPMRRLSNTTRERSVSKPMAFRVLRGTKVRTLSSQVRATIKYFCNGKKPEKDPKIESITSRLTVNARLTRQLKIHLNIGMSKGFQETTVTKHKRNIKWICFPFLQP